MIWSRALVCLAAVISLLVGAIWPNTVVAADAPAVVSLGSIDAGLSVPGKLDVDATGNLYVVDIPSRTVLKVGPSGDFVRAYDAASASGRGLAVTPDGAKLYVATDDQVVILNGETGAVVGQIDLDNAGEIDLDAAGNVYVIDFANTQVKVYDAAGTFVSVISGFGAAAGQFKTLEAMSINTATDEVFVVGRMGSNDFVSVQIFDLSGTYQGVLSLVGEKLGSGGGVTFDATDREYYLDKLTGKVHVRPRTTGFAPVVFDISGHGPGQVLQPWDIAFDVLTSRFFVSSDSGEIEVFGVDGGTTPEKNIAPELPTAVSPIANSEVSFLQPQLRFTNAFDLNGDSLTYDVEISGAASLQYSVAEDAAGETTVQVDQDLLENAAYSWKVMARDAELDSGWTQAQTFYVNAVEEAPSAPVISSALAGEALAGADLLQWQASSDNDPFETISYRVEIAADNAFADPTISEQFGSDEVSLDALSDYPALVPGGTYFWRVTAVDSSGLETVSAETGNFRYDTAVLSVDANLPGARVFFGGNAAYSGKFVGTTPLEMRDMAAGPYTVVVERAGCETFIAQVEMGPAGSVQVNANLLLAVEPALKKASALRSVKNQLQSGALVAPFVVDFDNDDLADLLVGDDAGSVNLFRALSKRGAKVQYGDAESLDFGQLPDTALFVVDWNNDNKKDVLVGAADGTISIYLQMADSSDLAPQYDSSFERLRDSNGQVIDVGAQANPAVVDFDGDSDKDLVVGTGNGQVYLYLNNGSDSEPVLSADKVTLMSLADGSVSPLFVDWDADGTKDLLVAFGGSLLRCVAKTDGTYEIADILVDAEANRISEGARFFVTDADNSQGKDVYVGQADGLVQVMRSAGKVFLPSVSAALLDKLAQVNDIAAAAGIDIAADADVVSAEISAGDFGAAARAMKSVAAAGPAGSDLYIAASELIALLDQ